MSDIKTGKYWNDNAEAWTRLTRQGYDTYRDQFNTPSFLNMLPSIEGLSGLDIGCGEGHNTRLLARKGARMTAIDISEEFIAHCRETENQQPLNIDYQVVDAVKLPFKDNAFDFVTGFMSFMDIPEIENVLAEVYRVLKPGGFLQFSITHPCFHGPYRKNVKDKNGKVIAVEVAEYFQPGNHQMVEWTFSSLPDEIKKSVKPFRYPVFHRTLSEWINGLIDKGFILEKLQEPYPTDQQVTECPNIQDAQVTAYFLHIRTRKPEASHDK